MEGNNPGPEPAQLRRPGMSRWLFVLPQEENVARAACWSREDKTVPERSCPRQPTVHCRVPLRSRGCHAALFRCQVTDTGGPHTQPVCPVPGSVTFPIAFCLCKNVVAFKTISHYSFDDKNHLCPQSFGGKTETKNKKQRKTERNP